MTLGDATAAITVAPTESIKRATSAAKRKAEARRPETLEEARERLAKLKWTEADRAVLDEVIEALKSGEIRRADDVKRLSKKEVGDLWRVLCDVRRQAKLDALVANKPANYRIITAHEEFERFVADLYNEPFTAWDTETTGLDLFCDRIVGFSVWLPRADYGVYVPFGHETGEEQLPEEVALGAIKDYLENPENKTIWHNSKYDMHMLRNHGINVADPYFDTQVAAHVLNENESHRLKDLAPKYLGVQADHFDSLFGDDPTIYDKPIGPAGVYAIKDVEFTWKLYNFQRPHIDSRPGLKYVFWNIEIPQIRVSLEMERQGFAVDLEGCKKLESEFEVLVEEALKSVHEAFGTHTPEFLAKISKKLGREITEFNVASPEQLQFLIYDYLGLPDISKQVNPKLQPRSTAHAVIEKLAEMDERLVPLLDYREKEKLLNTYIRKFPEMRAPDGKIHYSLSQFGTETGRYSSAQYGDKKNKKGVNIQNQPSRSKAAKKVKGLLIADPGWLILSSDLSQIEPRILAHMSGDELLRAPYQTGDDLYIRMAMDLYGFERKYCEDGAYDPTDTFQPRKRAKTGLLASMYGTSKWTLAQQMHISVEEAEQFLETFFSTYKGVKKFIDDTHDFVYRNEYVETMFGRKRRFPGFRAMMDRRKRLERIPYKRMTHEQREELAELRKNTNGILRASVNARIQGSAADVMKLILAEMYKLCQRKGWKIVATVHDEVNMLVPETVTPEDVEEVEKIMTQTVKLAVPMKCDTTLQRRWGEEIPWREWFKQKEAV
jgi:DNA polymerase-1